MEKKQRNFKPLLIGILFVVILAIGAAFYGYNWYTTGVTKPISSNTETVNLKIETGTTAQEIGQLLKDKGLIKDTLTWQIYVKLNKPNILADEYDIPQNLSLEQIVAILEVGQKDDDIQVTIPEGLRMDEIETILDSKLTEFTKGKYSKEEFHELINSPDGFLTESEVGKYISNIKPPTNSLEGFLFPDTYAFTTKADAKEVLLRLLTNFKEKTEGLVPKNGLSPYKNLILSTIVEREASEKDYIGVASVFLTRLEIGEKLGSDITVLYILKRWKPEPDWQELEIDSPYNTRLNYGLPPAPVGNPGIKVINATESATPGDNLFFLADDQGNIYYGQTLADHEYLACKYISKECQ